ncbi:hypothetical protein R1sor_022805 [Riccia sorocarpa]|uniref:DUF4283 domain-containing protein n=1 Tax=Riccia sorocarpa TaxID=122646 RepID=A0ABD3GRW1_9MARC
MVDSGKSRAHIFANSPLKMGNKMVSPLPWDTKFSTRDLKSRAVPVWLELNNVHPCLMSFGLNMLRKIGPIIYTAKNLEAQRRGHFARACPLNQPREETTGTGQGNNPGRRPTATGNQGARRPTGETGAEATAQRDNTTQPGDGMMRGTAQDDFSMVRRRGKPRFQTPEIKRTMRVDNRYGVLEEPYEEPEVQPTKVEETWEIRTRTATEQGPTARRVAEVWQSSSLSEVENSGGSRGKLKTWS